jgi:DNA processing protein
MNDQRKYWVGFNLVKGIGAVRMQALLDHFGDLSIAWQSPIDALMEAGLSHKIAENVLKTRQSTDLDKLVENIRRKGIQVLTRDDETYPARLKEIDQPPPVLYVRGSIQDEDTWAVAIVGTRRVTVYGRQVTEEVSRFLAINGVTVVSGLARGVDAIAHDSALKASGRTFAVLGSGVDRIYPPENLSMAEKIIRQGAIISDYAPGTPPDGVNFPPRNRIISGLAQAVIVVEAGETSGALITAQFAAEQGREVFAVPGNINAIQSKGTNRLIQDGAHPLLKPEDVLDILHLEQIQQKSTARKLIPADETEAQLLGILGSEPIYIDEIQARAGLSIDKVSATLTLMELKGLIRQVGHMNYVAVRETPSEYRVD